MDLVTMIATQLIEERSLTKGDVWTQAVPVSEGNVLRRVIEQKLEGLSTASLGEIVGSVTASRLHEVNGALGNTEIYRHQSGLGILQTLAIGAVLGKIKVLLNDGTTQVGPVRVHSSN